MLSPCRASAPTRMGVSISFRYLMAQSRWAGFSSLTMSTRSCLWAISPMVSVNQISNRYSPLTSTSSAGVSNTWAMPSSLAAVVTPVPFTLARMRCRRRSSLWVGSTGRQ